MNHFRRLGALLLTVLLIGTINTPVLAAETKQVIYDYQFDITPDTVSEDGSVIIPLSEHLA